jgi:hypothetical protein
VLEPAELGAHPVDVGAGALEGEVELGGAPGEGVALEAEVGDPERVDDVDRGHPEADLGVGRDDEHRRTGGPGDLGDAERGIVEAPVPLGGGHADPEARGDVPGRYLVLGVEGQGDEEGHDAREDSGVDERQPRGLLARGRPGGVVLAGAEADEREDAGEDDDREDGGGDREVGRREILEHLPGIHQAEEHRGRPRTRKGRG